ncbi:hypothetical protein JA1_003216 [Spathaspora sp. JA1]|nr:hypothetical protein JA1_003216 [Spathaspora sp. JA1]
MDKSESTVLDKNGLQLNVEKSRMKPQVRFLGYVIAQNKISPVPEKMKAIMNWKLPTTSTEIRSIINFTSYFRQFYPNISKWTAPLNDLLKNNAGKRIPIQHTPTTKQAFDELKNMLLYVPALYTYQPNKTTCIFTDASDYAIAGLLSQAHHINGKELLVPIAFASYKLTDTQSRYSALGLAENSMI